MKTTTKLLLISKGSTFMIDAIVKNVEPKGFEIIKCEPTVKDLMGPLGECDVVLLYLGDYVEEAKEAFVYLKDTCIGAHKTINVIGDATELSEMYEIIPEGLVENVFSRPLDIKKLAEIMGELGANSKSDARKPTILLVDDDPVYLKMIKEWLSDDYRVVIVNSGMQAFTYIAKSRPDLILLDYEMPVTNGPKVLEMIRSEKQTADIPVIFLTGKDDKESVEKGLSLRPQGYILKTLAKAKLLEQVNHFFLKQKKNIY
ncbi:MAG: response regulator [Pseudobutyrivibrio sp.]|nr:response regulator [Pseudobutyrivibrio sp.]